MVITWHISIAILAPWYAIFVQLETIVLETAQHMFVLQARTLLPKVLAPALNAQLELILLQELPHVHNVLLALTHLHLDPLHAQAAPQDLTRLVMALLAALTVHLELTLLLMEQPRVLHALQELMRLRLWLHYV